MPWTQERLGTAKPSLLGSGSGRTTPSTSSTAATVAALLLVATARWFTGNRDTTSTSADRSLRSLLLRLDVNPQRFAVGDLDPHPTLSTLVGRERREDGPFSGLELLELDEGASLGANDFQVLNSAKACTQSVGESWLSDGFDNTLR